MKHRLSALLDGMEMTRSEHDWLEQRFDNMTAKEELLFRGAVGIEHPKAVQDAIQILQSLEHYRLLYGADDDVTLGRFVMEHIHSPTPAARAYHNLLSQSFLMLGYILCVLITVGSKVLSTLFHNRFQ